MALRLDRKVKLVAYPYYAKYAMPRDKTSFRHIDVDVSRMIRTRRGANMVQGTVSLTNEDSANYTKVAFRLHHYIEEW